MTVDWSLRKLHPDVGFRDFDPSGLFGMEEKHGNFIGFL
jgi:hypothetical protein